jgi:hypothetical protein
MSQWPTTWRSPTGIGFSDPSPAMGYPASVVVVPSPSLLVGEMVVVGALLVGGSVGAEPAEEHAAPNRARHTTTQVARTTARVYQGGGRVTPPGADAAPKRQLAPTLPYPTARLNSSMRRSISGTWPWMASQ